MEEDAAISVTLVGVSYEKERQEKLLTNLYKHLFKLSNSNLMTNECRNTFYSCAEEWSGYFQNGNWPDPEFPRTPNCTSNKFCSLIESTNVRETALRVMDVYLIYNSFPFKESKQRVLSESLVKLNNRLKSDDVLKAYPGDPPEVQTLINIYGVLRSRTPSSYLTK